MIKNYRVKATGSTGYADRPLMEVDVSARNAKEAIATARRRSDEYFDRHDYVAGTLRWEAKPTSI